MLNNNDIQNNEKIIIASSKYHEKLPSKKIIQSNCKKTSIKSNNNYNEQNYSYHNINTSNTRYPYINLKINKK